MKKILKNLIALRDQTFQIRKVRRNGSSFIITLLPAFIRQNGLDKKDSKVTVEMTASNSLIIVPIVPEETTIEHLNLSEERK